MFNAEMESVFSRFDSYDFQADQRFQDGLKVLHKTRDQARLQDLKLFFYNRFVEPIDPSSYKQWHSAPPAGTPMDSRPDRLDHRTAADPDSGVGEDQSSGTSAETELQQLSFSEVMQLIQEGKEVPGTVKLDIRPSNQNPTPSQMDRVLKPWETASASD
nr:uncharacterized protein C6orf226 homolog [Echeneis naucrates]